jgi:signal transduction histidine kinase
VPREFGLRIHTNQYHHRGVVRIGHLGEPDGGGKSTYPPPNGGAMWPIVGTCGLVVTLGMDTRAATRTQTPDALFEASHPLRPLVLAGAVTLVAYTGGVFAVWLGTGEYVPNALKIPWIGAALIFVVIWFVLVVTMWARRPNAREAVRIWGHASVFITVTSQLVVIWAIWIFFPLLPDERRMLLSGMFLICSPTQLIAAPENVTANRFGIVVSLGSLVTWLVLEGSQLSLIMAGFAAGIGLMLYALCNYVPGTVAQTVEARLAAEEAKTELEVALVTVANERDAKTRFIAAASHDLGQPLQAASLFFDQTMRAPDASSRARAAEGVRKSFASADQLLSHMLNHLRLEADAVSPHFAKLSVGPILARIASQFGPAAHEAGVNIKVLATSARLRIDRVLFERALGNLIHNAIVHSGASQILVGVRKSGQAHVRIWVIDNGVGIAQVDATRVFEDYYQGSDSRAAAKSGFGLGLSSVSRLAILMDGAAGLEPRWLSGSAFYLEFPVIDPTTLPTREVVR